MHNVDQNARPNYDQLLITIADYVVDHRIMSEEAYTTAYYCLLDTLGCGFLALTYPACTKLLGPLVPEVTASNGVKVPGRAGQLDPVKAAFDIGTMVRWLDYNDTWLAAEWGHPSDNLGAILASMDYICRFHDKTYTVRDILTFMIKAHEIQGVIALKNSFNRVGLDHVILVKLASTAVATVILGGTKAQVIDALSQAFVDGQSLRTYRHAPNTGSRKSWAAGDATSRAVWLALTTLKGEMGYPTALSAKTWGFNDVLFKGCSIAVEQGFESYVMENILFKISYPAEFHSQTAIECAVKLQDTIKDRMNEIERIELTTHESAIRIISKTGPLHNPADRDHCLQYMVAIALLFGNVTAEHYEDNIAKDPRIDRLRELMQVSEDKRYTSDYLDPQKRSITNGIQLFFKDGTSTEKVIVEYPIGHRRRRKEGIPVLIEKFKENARAYYKTANAENIIAPCLNQEALLKSSVLEFQDLLTPTLYLE